MRNSRKVIESGILTAVLAIAAAATAVSGNVTDTSQSSQQEKEEKVFLAQRNTAADNAEERAVIAVRKENTQVDSADAMVQNQNAAEEHFMVNVAETEIQGYINVAEGSAVSAVDKKTSVDEHLNNVQEDARSSEEAEEASEWDAKLMANVENNMNVRQEASEESEIVGKIYKGAAAEIVEAGEEWTKIKSGNVEGYVKNEFCVFGEDAKALADEICETYATATTDGLRVRTEANTDAQILTMLTKDQKLTVDTDAEVQDGWIAVECQGKTAYLCADYAEVTQDIKTAMTLQEEQEMIAAQEAAKREAEEKAAAEKAAQASASSSVSADSGISSSVDDATLLAALIYCEAGGESYEGQLAVGAVVVNRVQSGAYPNSISGVIYQSGQFTPASSGKLARVLANGSGNSCMKAAQEALSGADNTGGALGFHAGKGSGTVIGNQTFY